MKSVLSTARVPKEVRKALSDPDKRKEMLKSIYRATKTESDDGISVDIDGKRLTFSTTPSRAVSDSE